MKRLSFFLIIATVIFMLSSCGNNASTDGKPASAPAPEPQTLSMTDFEALLSQQPLTVIHTEYVVQDTKYKTLYPDMLQAVIQNNTKEDIKNATVAFVAWDANNLPVKLMGNIDFSDGSYIKEVEYDDINLVGGATYGEDSGYSIDEDCNVATFKAIVVSYETFDGDIWENPYYDVFVTTVEGKKLTDELTFEVIIVEEKLDSAASEKKASSNKAESADVNSVAELEALLSQEPVSVISTKYVVQDAKYKTLYPDMLQAVIQNNTEEDIKNAVVAFVAWDANNLPVKLKGSMDFSDGSYIKQVDYSDINLVGGATYGEGSGYSIDEDSNVTTFKAMVVSYETFDGTTWKNPHYNTFQKLFEGQRLTLE